MDGSGSRVQFEAAVPVDNAGLIANIQHALGLRLPELRDFEYARREPLTILANGPSARQYKGNGKHVLALNGALRFCDAERIVPDFWAACDPQSIVTDFLHCAPYDTTYLVASKCHPSVFERLQDRNVVLWHVWERATAHLFEDRISVPAAQSITGTAFELATHLGYRAFKTWGWDACYMDGQSHAAPQFNAGEDRAVEIVRPDRTSVYQTTTTWAMEAQDIMPRLVGFPYPIHIHGGGYMGDLLSAFLPYRVTADKDLR